MIVNFINSEMQRLCLNQKELAIKAKADPASISRILKGANLTVEMAAKLVSAGVDLEGLLNAETTQRKEAILKILNG